MKNSYLKKFLALSLSGIMLTGVGCKDYDDDIDGINKRLDAIDVTISSLPEQLNAIKNSIPDISGLTSKVTTLEGKVSGIETDITNLKKLETSLKNYCDTEIGKATSADALKKTLGQYYATASALSDLDLKLQNAIKKGGSVDVAITDAITALKNDASNWMGTPMQAYLDAKGYSTLTVEQATNAASEKILEEIKKEQSAYKSAIEDVINGVTITKIGNGIVSSEKLDANLKALIEKIEPLISRVAELEGRIQSIVFVPSSLDEAQKNTVNFTGASWISFAGTKYYLGSNDQPTAVLKFRVSPASLAPKMTAETLSIITEEISRAAVPSFTIKEVKDQNAETGEFKVTITTDYKFGANAGKTLAFALNVKIASESKENPYGIDYTSSYLGSDYQNGGEINSKLVIAKDLGEGKYEQATTTRNTELAYNSTATVNFMDGFTVYYKDGETFSTLASLWSNAPEIAIVAPTAKAVASANAADYNLAATSVSIKNVKTALIGNTITSSNYTYNVKADGKTLKVADVKEVVTISSVTTSVAAKAATSLVWKYAIAKSDAGAGVKDVYTTADVALNNVISAAEFKALASAPTKAYKVLKASDNSEVVAITAEVIDFNSPTADADVQQVKVKLTGNLKATESYIVKATYTKSDATATEISIPVNVTGMPVIPAQTITYVAQYDGTLAYTMVADFAGKLWDANKAALEAHFANKTEFVTAIKAATPTATKNGKATLSLTNSNADISVTFDADFVFATNYTPSLKLVDAKATGLEVVYKSTVSAVKPTLTLVKNPAYFNEDGSMIVSTTWGDDAADNAFTVNDRDLAPLYTASAATPASTIEYTISQDFGDFAGTQPTVSGTTLSWKDWNQKTLAMKATLKVSGVVVATQDFVAKIADPVAAAITEIASVDATIYARETTKTFDAKTKLSLLTEGVKNAGLNIFGAKMANLNNTLDGSVKFEYVGTTNPSVSVHATTGVVTFTGSDAEVVNPIEVNIKVTYTYRYGTRTHNMKVTVREGLKPNVP